MRLSPNGYEPGPMIHNPAVVKFITDTIRVEKARSGLSWADISDRLKGFGVDQSAANLRLKASRGIMSTDLFVELLTIMGVERLQIGEMKCALEQDALD